MGAANRNGVRAQYLAEQRRRAYLSREVHDPSSGQPPVKGIAYIRQEGQAPHKIRTPLQPAIVEKVIDREDGRRPVFFCLAERADGTYGAVEYLVRHWKRLERQYGDRASRSCWASAMKRPTRTITSRPCCPRRRNWPRDIGSPVPHPR